MSDSLPLFDSQTIEGPCGEEALRILAKQVADCVQCRLHKSRTNVVFGFGKIDSPSLMIVGEAPGKTEDEGGEPFIGQSGKLLTRALSLAGGKREDFYICNVVKCRPPDNRTPKQDEILSCRPFLLAQIRAVKPKLILALGTTAGQALLKSKKNVSDLRGKWHDPSDLPPVRVTYHPAYVLRQGSSARSEFEQDLKTTLQRATSR